ncbi:MAG: hypothetical protein EOM91_14855 [Sphingobacteriia bacterium]|nr:hypothetical protein [Sphingobacteriia bacterium]NCC38475.1 hypothetical protein [Gammaproteobacteria bacterium]
MDALTLNALKDVAGVPSHPLIFLILGVVTFTLHMVSVQVMLGAAGLTIWGAFSRDRHWRRLAQSMLLTAKIAVSIAIVLGVAPLLFVQVIYDPFWYVSNVLSAWWVIGFIVILIFGYLLIYVFYGLNHHLATEKTRCPGSMILSLLLLLVVGFIMHVLVQQMLSPDLWMSWYAPAGAIDASGTGLHDYDLFRFAFFVSLSTLVIGAWLIAYRRYVGQRADARELAGYLDWVRTLAVRLSLIGGLVSLLLGLAWLMTLPERHAAAIPVVLSLIAMTAILIMAIAPSLLGKRLESAALGYGVMGLTTLAILLTAVAREALRWNILQGIFGYAPLDYRINMDWYSTGLFFATFLIVGGLTLGYYLGVAWKSGQSAGVYTPSPALDRLGTLSISVLVLWIIHFFAVGFWIWMQ